MPVPTGPKLQLTQIERIRADNTHIADALEATVAYVNANTTPVAGNVVAPANSQTAVTGSKIVPLNALRQ
jgi:hypothetical protein